MLTLAKTISAYIEYLRAQGLTVSFHFTPDSTARIPHQVWEELLPYNSHNNPYCLAVKSNGAEKCIAHQSHLRSVSCGAPFCGSCYAGVLEYVFPISQDGETVGYAAVSGYLANDVPALPKARGWADSLVRSPIPKSECDVLVPPLVIMLSNLLRLSKKLDPDEKNLISQYLAENHTTLDFDKFCSHFSRSRSYMSHKFAKYFGASFSSYCNSLRLEDARRMLLVGDEAVTDIALGCGFGDVSYFIRLFKAKYGESPLKYRKHFNKVDI